MTQKSGNFVEKVDFSQVTSWRNMMAFFIKVARSCPNQASDLFEKYVSYIKTTNPEWTMEKSRDTAKDNIFIMMGHYGHDVTNLFHKAYKELRQK